MLNDSFFLCAMSVEHDRIIHKVQKRIVYSEKCILLRTVKGYNGSLPKNTTSNLALYCQPWPLLTHTLQKKYFQ